MENEMEQPESEGMKNLRESRDREKARADALEAQMRNMVFKQAGVDTDSWVGQQLASAYDGELDPSAVRTFAEEKGVPISGEVLPEAAQQALNDQAAAQARQQQQVGQMMAGTESRDAVPSPEQEAQKRLADGDVKGSIALKAQQFTNR